MWTVSKCNGVYLLNVRNGILRFKSSDKSRNLLNMVDLYMLRSSAFTERNVDNGMCCPAEKVNCSTILQEGDLLMFKNSSFTVRKFEICAVLCSNEVDFLMLRNRLFRQRNDQKCAVRL